MFKKLRKKLMKQWKELLKKKDDRLNEGVHLHACHTVTFHKQGLMPFWESFLQEWIRSCSLCAWNLDKTLFNRKNPL
ncbi:hypothetical protein NDQ53_13865 [Rossellomorea marisflavi]|uniref:hypothetical protein n=1 Tax=Rossellomorea marisflavi TaxID=189381 RepID=UPI0020403115|nr:hypothetical protein [Rossellomorea marisflavi]MCM2590384.1 hypothetical protein [Rossellomorea marisflavi]